MAASTARTIRTDPKPDMAEMPVQLPAAPRDDAGGRARFFNSGNAFNIKLPAIPAAAFRDEAARAVASGQGTGLMACDQSAAMGMAGPATTPLMLARYARIEPGETLALDFAAVASIWFVIAGSGTAQAGAETLCWGAGDVMLLPGGPVRLQAGRQAAVLWVVTDEPLLAFDGAIPPPADRSQIHPVHYPASEIERQIGLIYAASQNEATSGMALIFSSQEHEASRNITASLTLSLNTLPPGEVQRAHRHNAAAITLVVGGEDSFTLIDGHRADWTPWATLVTPSGSAHSHHNGGGERALFLIVQDGGLHYHARTMGFAFLDVP